MTTPTVDLTELAQLRPRVDELVARYDAGHWLDPEQVAAIYDAERVAVGRLGEQFEAFACPGHGVDQLELADAIGAIAASISGVGRLAERWDDSPAAEQAMIDAHVARLVAELTAAGEDPDVIAAHVAELRANLTT